MEQVRISQGHNDLSKRDHITMVLHYGQIDRWVSFEKEDVIINSDNSDKIEVGQEVKISETLFMKWMKLITLVDRSASRKEDHHVRNKVSSVAKLLGYNSKNGLYKVLKPLYEVGLIDLKESNVASVKMIDIIAYPYPVYSDTPICVLKKIRKWDERKSFGFALSYAGVHSRLKQKCTSTVHKSEQIPEQKCTGVVHKSEQEPVHKSGQEPVHKSVHTNIYKSTNINNTSKDNNILSELAPYIQESLQRFKQEFNVTDDEMTEIILRLENFKPRSNTYASHRKYLQKTLATVRDEMRRRRSTPKILLEIEAEKSKVDKPKIPEFLRVNKTYEEMLEELQNLKESRENDVYQ